MLQAVPTSIPVRVIVNPHSGTRDEDAWTTIERRCSITTVGQNIGFGAACNIGIDLAEHPFVLLLNPDCLPNLDVIELLVQRMLDDDGLGSVGPILRSPTSHAPMVYGGSVFSAVSACSYAFRRDRVLGSRSVWAVHPPRAGWSYPFDVEWVAGTCQVLRVNAIRAIGGFDPRFFMYCEDRDLGCRLKASGWRSAIEPLAIAYHQGGGSTDTPRVDRVNKWASSFDLVIDGIKFRRLIKVLILVGLLRRATIARSGDELLMCGALVRRHFARAVG
jgi:N-acetylglucosaminyl-diphospho-decaprenol L-rhamnosyltransferase